RRQEDQQSLRLARVLRRISARTARLQTATVLAESRPPRAAVVLRVAVVLQPREHLRERAARVSPACVPPRTLPLDRCARHTREGGTTDLEAGDPPCRRGLPDGLPDRPQRRGLERDRRRLRRRDRRGTDRDR